MKKAMSVLLSLLIVLLLVGISPVSADTRVYDPIWLEPEEIEEITDYAYTFAFVGDTQKVARYDPDNFHKIYDWIVDVAEEKNLKYVFGLGDITDQDRKEQWEVAIDGIQRLDGVVPYSLIRGNHDDIMAFVRYCTYDSYTSQLDGMYNGKVLNSYKLLTIGTINYLLLNLDHGPSDAVLKWAGDLIEQYPEHNVIITTHGYIRGNGELLSPENSTVAPSKTTGINDGPAIWEKLVSKYENIVMVVCGHVGARPQLVNFEVTGDHGNKIQHVLVDPQELDMQAFEDPASLEIESGTTGLVAMFYFSEDGKTVRVENYSTIQEKYYGEGITFTLNSMGGNANKNPINKTTIILAAAAACVIIAIAVAVTICIKKKQAKKS